MVSVHWFAADIHLRPESENAVARFVSWLDRAAREADAVYILGDLFDYWYSGMEARFSRVIEALRSPKVHLMAGNRDFLLRNAGITGLGIVQEEETTITVGGRKILLAHGHTLTEADAGFRLLHRYGWPVIERIDRVLPVSAKDRLARAMVRSSAAIRPPASGIRRDIAREKGVNLVICGHLHRHVEREGLIVLPAFFDAGAWLAMDDVQRYLETLG